MVAAIFLVTRRLAEDGVNQDKNLVREVIMHQDDGDSDAVIIAQAITGLNAQNPVEADAEAVYPAGYFDTVVQIGAAPVADLSTEFDFLAYAPRVSFLDA